MLYTAIHMGFYPCVVHMILYFRHDTLDEGFPDAPLLSDLLLQVIISLRLQIFQR